MSDLGLGQNLNAQLPLEFAVEGAPKAPKNGQAPAMLYNTIDGKAPNGDNEFGLRSDCQPAANCQAGQLTTAYNTTQFIAAEDFVPATSDFMNTACLQGIFWNGTSDPNNAAGDCNDNGTEDWTLTFYKDTVGDGVPDTVVDSLTFCTGTGCTGTALPSGTGWSSDPNVTDATKDAPTGNPDFAGIPIVRISVDFANFGDDGFAATTPMVGGDCYFAEWAVLNGDTTSGVFGCAFFHQAGAPGNIRAMQSQLGDPTYDCCELLSEDLTLCIDIALDNSLIVFCDNCTSFPPINESCTGAITLTPGAAPTSVDTAGAINGNGDLPFVPDLGIAYDPAENEGVWYQVLGTGTQLQVDYTSAVMDTVLFVYCGTCGDRYYGVGGNDDIDDVDTNSRYVIESELGKTYYVYASSNFKCGTGFIQVTDLTTGSTVPAEQCSSCTLVDYGTATIDETVLEPCGADPGTNDGCNAAAPTIADFIGLVDGDVIAGNADATAGTRDLDWYWFNQPDPAGAIVTWQGNAQFNYNMWIIDMGGDINNPDCVNTTTVAFDQGLRCEETFLTTVLGQGDWLTIIGPSTFDFIACGADNDYNAFLSIASCDVTDPGENLEGEQCSSIFQNNEGCNRSPFQSKAITPGDGWYFGNAWANGNSRDTDWYSWTQGSSGEVAVTFESEFPAVLFIIDLGPGGLVGGAGCDGTTVDAWATVACNQLNFTSSTLTAGNDYILFVSLGNLDGSGIFGGFPCGSGFNDYVFRVDGASSGACLAAGVTGVCYTDCVALSENDCTSQCGVYYGDGVACPATPCIADQTTTGAPAGDPLFGIPDGQVTGADIQFFINLYIAFDCRADLTTTGAGVGNSGYGIRDGSVTGSDLQFFVNAYVDGVATLGASCNPGGPCTP